MSKKTFSNPEQESPANRAESKQIGVQYERGGSGRTFYLVTPEVEIAANKLVNYFSQHSPDSTNWSAFRHNFNELANLSERAAQGNAEIESVRRFAEELIMMVNLDIKSEQKKS